MSTGNEKLIINQHPAEDAAFNESGKKHLFIIPCCSRKSEDGDMCEEVPLTYFFNPIKGLEIVNLIGARGIHPANPIAFANPPIQRKAWDLYDGQFYTRLKALQPMINLKRNQGKLEIIIVSALYGVVNYDSCVQKYNLTMPSFVDFWGATVRQAIVKYIIDNKFDTVHSFLTPTSYHRVATQGAPLHNRHHAYWADLVAGRPMRGSNNIYNSVANKAIAVLNQI